MEMAICRTETIELENMEPKSIKRNGRAFSNRQNLPVHLQIDVRLDMYPLHITPDFRYQAVRIEPDACIVRQAPEQLPLDLCAEG
jgi:hypothetical protein